MADVDAAARSATTRTSRRSSRGCARSCRGAADVSAAVARIVADVRAGGDAALRRYAGEHDGLAEGAPCASAPLSSTSALATLDPGVRGALELAIDNVARRRRAGLGADATSPCPRASACACARSRSRRAAIYVPGGRAPYPSTVVMGVVTARAAGVDEVVVCAPGGASR